MIGKEIIFLIFVAITIGSAAMVVLCKKIIYAAFSLMLSFFWHRCVVCVFKRRFFVGGAGDHICRGDFSTHFVWCFADC